MSSPSRRRKRSEISQPQETCTKAKDTKDDSQQEASFKTEDASDDTSKVNLTPQIRRLLTLVREGTTDHATLAAEHLVQITSTCTPLVLWDVLGCLQGLLTSNRWRTRYNASISMRGVATHLPDADQRDFLRRQSSPETQKDRQWLTLVDVCDGNIDNVLDKGTVLLSSSEDPEEDQLERLDQNYRHAEDFAHQRIQWQRQVLARKLGFSDIIQRVGTGVDVSSDDLLPSTATKRTKTLERIQNREKGQDGESSIRAILVIGMKHSRQSHRNPQELLATELIYRMFDPSWHVRHGSLLGILSLIRAWKVHHRSRDHFGAWLHDILVRCLCLLTLDRFEDYSGATVEGTGGVVAPVRELAGQALSVLLRMAPESVRIDTMDVLLEISRRDEWEVRQAVQISFRYIFTVISEDLESAWSASCAKRIGDAGVEHLSDRCDDVQSAAAQTLSVVLDRIGTKLHSLEEGTESGSFIERISAALWPSLRDANPLASSLVDLVGLFSQLVSLDCYVVLTNIDEKHPNRSDMVILRLMQLLEPDSQTLRVSVLKSMNKLLGPLVAISPPSISCLGDAVSFYFHSYWILTESIEPNVANHENSLTHRVWLKLIGSFDSICANEEGSCESLEDKLILDYASRCTHSLKSNTVVTGHHLQRQMKMACALSIFLERPPNNRRSAMLELCVSTMINSPLLSHVQSACLLVREINLRPLGELPRSFLSRLLSILLQKMNEPFTNEIRRGTSVADCARMWQESVSQAIKLIRSGKSDIESAMRLVTTIMERSITAKADSSPGLSLDSIRMSSAVACSVVSFGLESLPTKLTPLIRALMTSVKNESEEICQLLTSSSLASLLLGLSLYSGGDSDKTKRFAKTSVKVIESICTLTSGGPENSMACASLTLQDMARQLPASCTVSAIPGLWVKLSALSTTDLPTLNEGKTLSSVRILRVFSEAMNAGSNSSHDLVSRLLENLVSAGCCSSSVEIFSESSATITQLCKLDVSAVLSKSIPAISKFLLEHKTGFIRERSCEILCSIVKTAGTNACRFVRQLLPLSMELMTDPIEACAKLAAELFGIIVKIAPMTPAEPTDEAIRDGGDGGKNAVIDHLIHGKPLPPCVYPARVSQALANSGTILRSYQSEGVSWLRFLQQTNLSGALCDSMGLGKTLQALVGIALSHHIDEGSRPKSLIICPATVVGHWVREVGKYFGDSGIFVALSLTGNMAQREAHWKKHIDSSNLVITSYSVLRSDIRYLMPADWKYCVLDEGHLLKNPKTATAKAARKLRSRHRLILTGTPVQNNVDEVWATFDYLMPNFLGTFQSFRKDFSRPITKGQLDDAPAEDIVRSMNTLRQLHQQVLPFVLRREKSEVLKELPPKIITVIPCDMGELQRRIYDDFCNSTHAQRALDALQQLIQQMSNPKRSEENALGSEVLKLLLVLRLACTHPCLIKDRKKERPDKNNSTQYTMEQSGKLVALKQLLQDAGICHSGIAGADSDLSALYNCDDDEDYLEDDDYDARSTISPTSQRPAIASSLDREDQEKWSKCLVFAQFASSLDVVEQMLLKVHMPNVRYLRLDGRVPAAKRSELVDTFNNDKDVRIMLISTKVGSLGLNLTGADMVVFLEPDWNPHTDLQSMDRAHRIGQTKTVNIFKLITTDSIEERILKIQERKLKMSDAIVNTDNSTLYSMGTDRLLDIFATKEGANTSHEDSPHDGSLDAIIDEYCEDYASLSVEEFVRNFRN